MSDHTAKPILTRTEAAEYITTCLRTLDENIANGNIAVIKIGRAIRIRRAALDSFLEANETRMTSKRRAAMGGKRK